MEASRWIRSLPPMAVLGALVATGIGRPPLLSAAAPPWQPPPCSSPAAADEQVPPAWYRLDAVLDRGGTLQGQRLTIGRLGGRPWRIDLSPESFASGPVNGRVLVGNDDGAASELQIIDVGRGCSTAVAREADVIRGAVLSPHDGTIWEHRVDRASRADLGIWRRGPDPGPAVRALPGMNPDERYGPTFGTELRLADDGRLTVSSCGELACRNRILDPSTGAVSLVEATGPVLGLHGATVITAGICHGYPCPIVAVDAQAGDRTVIVDDAGRALVGGIGGRMVVFEAVDGQLATIDLETQRRASVPGSAALQPVRDGSAATSGSTVPAGDLLVAPDGLVADPGGARVLDPITATIDALVEPMP